MLVAFATAAAGPIVFVALVAGPIAHRLLGPAPGGILAAALVGAIIVLAADLVAQHLLPIALPTGRGHRRGRRAVPGLAAGHRQPGRTRRMTAHDLRAQAT